MKLNNAPVAETSAPPQSTLANRTARFGPREDEPDFSEEFDRGTGINDPVEDREWAEKTGAR